MKLGTKWICLTLIVVGCSTVENKKKDVPAVNESKKLESAKESIVDITVGKSLYNTCMTCHGDKAQGNKDLNAPTLVNQESWYLERQLNNFKNGIRGYDPKDIGGMQMAPMAKLLSDEAAIKSVVGFIKSLPASKPATTIEGDLAKGKGFYNAICATCHGPNGNGNESLNAPRLVGVNDWYLLNQYTNFRDGIRGGHKDDVFGSQMKMMSNTLPNDETINNVLAYIQSL